MKYIYLYSTPTYIENSWFKVGETTQDPTQRIHQQDNASNPEKLVFLKAWKVDVNVTDKQVHKELIRLGFEKVRKSREWFVLSSTPITDIEDALMRICPSKIEEYHEKPMFDFFIPNYNEMWWFSKKS